MRGLKEDGECYFFLTTSQVDKYRSNPLYNSRLYVFPKGSISCFNAETAIDISQVGRKPFRIFENRYVNQSTGNRLDYKMMIPDDHLKAICNMISQSKEISKFNKIQLIGSGSV